MVRRVKVVRAGGSLVITLPPPVRDALRIARGDMVDLWVEGGEVRILRVDEAEEHRRLFSGRRRRS